MRFGSQNVDQRWFAFLPSGPPRILDSTPQASPLQHFHVRLLSDWPSFAGAGAFLHQKSWYLQIVVPSPVVFPCLSQVFCHGHLASVLVVPLRRCFVAWLRGRGFVVSASPS